MEINVRKAVVIVLLSAYAALALPACHQDGPAEKLGKDIDEAAHDAGRAVDDATD